jgi:hypothetical protein
MRRDIAALLDCQADWLSEREKPAGLNARKAKPAIEGNS